MVGLYVAIAFWALILGWLGRKAWKTLIAPKLVPMPVPGEVWKFKTDPPRDPWEMPTTHRVVIREVKKGWVRYKWEREGSMWQDERMKADTFRYCYEPISGG